MNAKWNPAVNAIALSRSGKVDWVGSELMTLPAVSSLLLGIAVCKPTFRLGTACAKTAFGSKSGLVMLRYRDQKLVSVVSWVRFVSRPTCLAPSALLLGNCANGVRSTGWTPIDCR